MYGSWVPRQRLQYARLQLSSIYNDASLFPRQHREMHTGSPEPPPKPVLPTPPSILLTSCSAFWGQEQRQDVEEVSSNSPTAWGQESKPDQRDPSAPGAVKELLEGSSKVLGGVPSRPSQPQGERRGTP